VKKIYDTIMIVVAFILIVSLGITVGELHKRHQDCLSNNVELTSEADQWREAYSHYLKTDITPIIKRLQPKLDWKLADRISKQILKYSSEYRLPPNLIIHIINRESGFRPLITSKAGALGLMQVIPKWHEEKLKEMKISKDEVYYIDNNIKLGCWIFREYFDQTGDIEKALKKYVGGSHDVYIKDILTGFANEAIVGVKNVQGMPEIEEGESGVETQTEPKRSGEHEEKSPNAQSSSESS